MKKHLVVLLSFLIFLSSCGISSFFDMQIKKEDAVLYGGISKVFAVQYDLCKNTKNTVIHISDLIIKDMISVLSHVANKKLFINECKLFIQSAASALAAGLKISFFSKSTQIVHANTGMHIMLLFFVFVFIFLTRYLGLLRTFWSYLTILSSIQEAYEIKSFMLLFFTGRIYEH